MPRSHHDVGGTLTGVAIDRQEHGRPDWQSLVDAVRMALSAKGLLTMDEVRRATEDLGPRYAELGYYERRVEAVETLLLEKGLVTKDAIDERVRALAEE